jgi:hypothetical protein
MPTAPKSFCQSFVELAAELVGLGRDLDASREPSGRSR